MKKLSKTVLKEIVKECLVEILSEGIGSPSPMNETKTYGEDMSHIYAERKRKLANQVSYNKPKNNAIEAATQITSDPILSEILKDTASTTMVEQITAERKNPGAMAATDAASFKVANNDLGDLFGDAASKWSTLAFSEKKF